MNKAKKGAETDVLSGLGNTEGTHCSEMETIAEYSRRLKNQAVQLLGRVNTN